MYKIFARVYEEGQDYDSNLSVKDKRDLLYYFERLLDDKSVVLFNLSVRKED